MHRSIAFPNTQGLIMVNAANAGRYFTTNHLHMDFMSIVTSLRNIGLVKLASLSHAIEHVRLGFNFQPQVLAHTDPEVFSH